MKKWDSHFFELCKTVQSFSTCLSRKVGVILVRDKTIVSTGFNGPPRGVTHCGEDRILRDGSLSGIKPADRNRCPRQALGFKSGFGLHLCTAGHAETNAIVNAARVGVSTLGTTMYMTCGIPCKDCLKLIINAGVVEIVCTDIDDWYDETSKFLVRESSLKIRNYVGEELS